MNNYWKAYWSERELAGSLSLQEQVERTKYKAPVDDQTWSKTVDFIVSKMNLNEKDTLLDLCSGNGLLAVPFSKLVDHVTAVDISEKLLIKVNEYGIGNIETICADISGLQMNDSSFSKISLYFSLQYFDDPESLNLINNIYKWLTKSGVAYIGDIPDADNMWKFFRTEEQKKAYFDSLLTNKPILGNWFSKEWLKNYCELIGFKAEIVKQPSFMFNSSYRFDLLLKK